jgi:hypothetical protein
MRRNRSHAVCFLRGGNCELNWATRCSMARCAGKANTWSGHWRYQVFHNNCAPVWSMRSSCASSQVQARQSCGNPANSLCKSCQCDCSASDSAVQRPNKRTCTPSASGSVVMRGRESSMALEVVVRSVGGGARMVQAQ